MIDITAARASLTAPTVPRRIQISFREVLDELEANRKRIVELEGRIVYNPITKEKMIRQVIIPQEGDANIMKEILNWTAETYFGTPDMGAVIDGLLTRYLAAIEDKT
jgi:hypothetical protein